MKLMRYLIKYIILFLIAIFKNIIFNLNSKNKSLFEKSELNFRNYQDFIINRVEKDFSPIINSNNISDKFQNIIK